MVEAIRITQESEHQWAARMPDFSDVCVYGATREEAMANLLHLVFGSIIDLVSAGEAMDDAVVNVLRAAAPLLDKLPPEAVEDEQGDAALAQEVLDDLASNDEELHDWDDVKAALGL